MSCGNGFHYEDSYAPLLLDSKQPIVVSEADGPMSLAHPGGFANSDEWPSKARRPRVLVETPRSLPWRKQLDLKAMPVGGQSSSSRSLLNGQSSRYEPLPVFGGSSNSDVDSQDPPYSARSPNSKSKPRRSRSYWARAGRRLWQGITGGALIIDPRTPPTQIWDSLVWALSVGSSVVAPFQVAFMPGRQGSQTRCLF